MPSLPSAPSGAGATVTLDPNGKLPAIDGSQLTNIPGGAPSGAAGGDLTGSTYPNPVIAAGAVTDTKVAAANKDGAAGTASMRTLGAGAAQACAGNDARLSDARTPTGAASGDLSGNYAGPTVKQSSVAFGLTGINSPTGISADQNDYNPAGLSTANTLRLSTDAQRTITGLQGGVSGRVMVIVNVGSFPFVLGHENAGSTAANRFLFDSYDLVLAVGQSVTLQYDSTSSRWRTLSGNALARSGGAFSLNGTISPAQITADQNNYAPASLATASILRLNTDAARTITGLTGGSDGRILVVINTGTKTLTLSSENASSTAANRFTLDGSDLVLAGGCAAILWYDNTTSRWRCIGTATKVSTTDVQSNTTITNSLTADTLATGMTATPKAGKYVVIWSGYGGNSNNNASIIMSLYVGGAQVVGTERQHMASQANARIPFSTQALVTVDGTQAIEGRWRASANTGTMIGKSFTVIEVTT